jgi:mannosylglycerate hydrolase MGH1-like protein
MRQGKVSREQQRIEADRETLLWRRWGPYLSERQWGTVREDYSADGSAWEYLPHDHARSRAYRWGEDGIAGICDSRQLICFALALWNGRDPILKERLFGLTGNEGNHGEDVKECYYYLDNTPTHSYMKYLYKYPQAEFPYNDLVAESRRRTKADPEYELLDTGVFDENRYFDVTVEYAKAEEEDILIRVTAANRGAATASIVLLPTLWCRNTWSWFPGNPRPDIWAVDVEGAGAAAAVQCLGRETYLLLCDGAPELLFTENDSNRRRLWGVPNESPFVKDAFQEYVIDARTDAVNPARTGTKCAALYRLEVPGGAQAAIRLRLRHDTIETVPFGPGFDSTITERAREADEFYAAVNPFHIDADQRAVQRQAFAGLLWNKQFYCYDVERWLAGDPAGPPPPEQHTRGRNARWIHFNAAEVLSMPDKWEYPWFAAWDLGFHVVPISLIDPDLAKRQLVLLTREWYMHPNGQLPAYEWAFDDVNPPVHAWAALRIYRIDKKMNGKGDRQFLERVFQKLLMNFTWWLNQKDVDDNDVFGGGFLGLDNIGVFDRSAQLPTGGHVDQADGTSWMGMYCLNMLGIALELAREDMVYEDIATKFFEHFLRIANAMNHIGQKSIGLWDEGDGFYYDVLHLPNGHHEPLKVRSMVGLIPLLALETLEPGLLDAMPGFKKRLEWFISHRPDLAQNVASMTTQGMGSRRLLAIVGPDKLRRVLARLLDENEFLSPHGIRSLSKIHAQHPYVLSADGHQHSVDYEPAESRTGLFGGNSNWRGPVWFPLNLLIIEALQKFHYYFGDDYVVECPTGSGKMMTLWEVSTEISHRLIALFARDESSRRPVFGNRELLQRDPHWRDLVTFFEYFNGDDGSGLGASHQTGWTGVVAKLIQQCGEYCVEGRLPEPAATARAKTFGAPQ